MSDNLAAFFLGLPVLFDEIFPENSKDWRCRDDKIVGLKIDDSERATDLLGVVAEMNKLLDAAKNGGLAMLVITSDADANEGEFTSASIGTEAAVNELEGLLKNFESMIEGEQ